MSAPELERLYAAIGPFLFGERSVAELEASIGSSASGTDALDFYRVLVERNTKKILGELFSPVRELCERLHPGLWPELVADYARSHRGAARDPNWFGEHFSAFLAARREQRPEQSPLLEELADYVFCRFAASTAPDAFGPDDPEGFERRLFVRLYTAGIPELLVALRKRPEAPTSALPLAPRPSTVLIFRVHRVDGESFGAAAGMRWHRPDLAQLAALARRQGLELPPPMAALDAAQLERGLAALVKLGVLRAS
ncbi:putative DNA-binding domain-containing protein [Pseudenhygromyxa sp. WMMC2535]|uniref:putative DNA-binding domain-containing protein n=1 Tax=Pseudenhygromyxa sp. WMMC2535 TaxID=2712867 RepID=UPI00155390F0|nr:putative DNA-binding domain-containing protein [Pseudenhygromyxa sp. WMMC2535]NVB37287.1 putative DNA-binding domain-containing protein [Pseudenhygromyxa sp. WMMC2535]